MMTFFFPARARGTMCGLGWASLPRYLALAIALSMVGGCASFWASREADKLIQEGHVSQGMNLLGDLAVKDPENYRVKYIQQLNAVTRDLMHKARSARYQNMTDQAEAAYREILRYDPQHADANQGLQLIERDRHEAAQLNKADAAFKSHDQDAATQILETVLAENPLQPRARRLQQQVELERNRAAVVEPAMSTALKKPVTLELRDVSVQVVLEILAKTSGINFILDKDAKADTKTTIFAKDTSIEDALNIVLRTSQLNKKILNDSTVLIYPDVDEKKKKYEDLVVRAFYLKSADSKKMQEMVRALVNPKSMYVDDRLRMLVVRDNLNAINAIERLVSLYDATDSEVVLEVEILEINSGDLLNLGIQYPDQVSMSMLGAAGIPGQVAMNELGKINRNNFQLFFPNPLAVLNLKQVSSNVKTLANPRIRVKNREKAKIMIGDKVPVITTTVNQTSSATTESVSYLDVGLKLDVEPEIHVDNEVSINVGLEVSNIAKEIRSSTGLLVYQIGTRNANTVLRLRDGETQVLAGLIKDEERSSATHIPGLGKIPLLGRLFSNTTEDKARSEIILLITPHVVRGPALPPAHVTEFASGTSENASTRPFRLTPAGQYSETNAQLVRDAAATASGSAAIIAPGNSSASISNHAPDAGSSSQGNLQPAGIAIAAGNPVRPLVNVAPPGMLFTLSGPAQAVVNQGFPVLVTLDGPAAERAMFDIMIDQSGVQLVSASPGAGATVFEAQQTGQVIRVTASKLMGQKGPIGQLTLKSSQQSNLPISFSIQQATAFGDRDQAIPVTGGAPVQVILQK